MGIEIFNAIIVIAAAFGMYCIIDAIVQSFIWLFFRRLPTWMRSKHGRYNVLRPEQLAMLLVEVLETNPQVRANDSIADFLAVIGPHMRGKGYNDREICLVGDWFFLIALDHTARR